MRTKALLCAAGLLAVGAFTAMAQSNVYSLNVVGYVNVSLTNGFNLMANQMDLDGNITNNTVQTVFSTNVPTGTKVYAFSTSSGFSSVTYLGNNNWFGTTASVAPGLSPGGAVWVQIPGSGGPGITLTEVGNVIQGSHSLPVAAGFQLMSIMAPVSTGVQTGAGYGPTAGDKVYLYANPPGSFSSRTFVSGTTWFGGEPSPAIGQGFWLQAKGATNWVQNFTVQ